MQRGKIRAERIAVTTTGSAGSATGTTTSKQIVGQVLGVLVQYNGSAPNTTDVTVEGATSGIDLYAKSNANTSVAKVPSLYGVSAANAALTNDVTPQRYCVAEGIKVTVGGCDALTDAVVVWVIYREVRAVRIPVTTTGSAGSATGSATGAPFTGELLGLAVDCHASLPGTADITVAGARTGISYWARSNSAADAFAVPVLFSSDAAGSALSSDVTPRRYCVGEGLTVSVAQGDALTDAVVVTAFYEPVLAETINVTTTGSAGSATGSADSFKTHGEILGVAVDYDGSAPNTTDVTLEHSPSGVDFFAKANTNTNFYAAPGVFGVSNADGALTSNVTPERFPFAGKVKAAVAGCDALTDAVKVTVFSRG